MCTERRISDRCKHTCTVSEATASIGPGVRVRATLRKVDNASLPDKLRKGFKSEKTVYMKLCDAATIDSIRQKMKCRSGLTPAELRIATEAGLVDWEQRYFWVREWQAGEHRADEDERAGRISEPFQTTAEALEHLHSLHGYYSGGRFTNRGRSRRS
jgi:hypothetical protein